MRGHEDRGEKQLDSVMIRKKGPDCLADLHLLVRIKKERLQRLSSTAKKRAFPSTLCRIRCNLGSNSLEALGLCLSTRTLNVKKRGVSQLGSEMRDTGKGNAVENVRQAIPARLEKKKVWGRCCLHSAASGYSIKERRGRGSESTH